MKTEFLLLYGYGWSGSGAVLDLLREIEGICISDMYFFLLRDLGGLLDLENDLLNDWDMFRSSAAIKNFEKLCKRSKKPMLNVFSVTGRDYKRQFGRKYDREIEKFLTSLTDFEYYSYEHSLNMDKNYVQTMVSRMIHKLDKHDIKLPLPKQEIYRFSRPEKADFIEASRTLINNLYDIENINAQYLLIDHHPLPVHNFSHATSYFGDDVKMIVVDRDPRDIYIDLLNNRMRIGAELYRSKDVHKYIEWHKKTRIVDENENIYHIQFESMINNYDQEVDKLLDFLGIRHCDHKLIKQYFNPKISCNNIGLWKKYTENGYREIFDLIEKELMPYCYNGD